jgi:hypothetical protein
MSFWLFEQVIEGYTEAHSIDDPNDKGKLSEEEADELWAWMEERQKVDPVPQVSSAHPALPTSIDAASPP